MRLRLFSLLIATVALAAQAHSAAYQITGQAVSARDGSPVPYCRISAAPSQGVGQQVQTGTALTLQMRDGGRAGRGAPGFGRQQRAAAANASPPGDLLETRSDASGHFSLDLPRGGRWAVRAEARGFRAQAYDEHENFFSSIVLTPGAPTFVAQFRLRPDAILRGRVLDEAGDPVAQGQVLLERVPSPQANGASDISRQRPVMAGGTQTNDQGEYELAGLAGGVYHLRVQAQPWYAQGTRGIRTPLIAGVAAPAGPDPSLDMIFPATWYPAATEEAGAEDLVLRPGEERQADLHLTAIPAAHLLLARPQPAREPENGRPRPMRPFGLTHVGSDSVFGQTSFVAGNGRDWDFGSLVPGLYEVRIPGTTPGMDEVRQVEIRPGNNTVDLAGSLQLTRVTIRCEGECGERLPLLVFDDLQTGRRIMANLSTRGKPPGEDEQGAATTSVMLPPHRYAVGVAANQGTYIAALSATGAKVSGKTVEIGDQPAALTVRAGAGRGQISGFVTLDRNADPGAMVLLVPATLGEAGDHSVIARDQSNTDGSYEFTAVIPGRYILVALDHGWNADWRSMAGLVGYLAKGLPIEVAPGAKLTREIAAVMP